MLSESEIARYHEDGDLVPRLRLGDDALDHIKQMHDRPIGGHPPFRDGCPTLLACDLGFLNVAQALIDIDPDGRYPRAPACSGALHRRMRRQTAA